MRKYIKCILTKGFAIVSEKVEPVDNCFPLVEFFDVNGDYLVSVSGYSLAPIYRSLIAMDDANRGSVSDHVVAELGTGDSRYNFSWLFGFLYITPKRSQPDKTSDAIIFLDGTAAFSLLQAINQLA